jgi:3-deoxy-D-manno-octulosonic-acid transferase
LEEIKNRPRWVANCTHRGEDEIIVEVHKKLKKIHGDLMTFLVPRHIDRIGEIEKLLRANNLKYTKTSDGAPLDNSVEIFLHDNYGNLGTIFDFCRIIFMGGSLCDGVGGHTPAESIKHNCCLVTGPHIENNLMLFRELQKVDGCLLLDDAEADTLAGAIDFLLNNPPEVERLAKNAYRRSIQYSGVMDEIMDTITSTL